MSSYDSSECGGSGGGDVSVDSLSEANTTSDAEDNEGPSGKVQSDEGQNPHHEDGRNHSGTTCDEKGNEGQSDESHEEVSATKTTSCV